MTSVCGEWGPCTSGYLFSGKLWWHWSENSNIRSRFRSECDILLKEGEKNKKSVHRSVFSQCETFDESWKMGKEHVQAVTAGLILFQHVCLNRAMRHWFSLQLARQGVSFRQQSDEKKSCWLDQKSKRVACTWTQLHYVIPCLLQSLQFYQFTTGTIV